jgi:nucleotide-binding universal stress UspA family protein
MVTPFQQILAAVDFSDLSSLALRYAAAIAKCAEAKLTLLYADTFSPPPYFTHADVEKLQRQFRSAFAQAEAGLRRFAAESLGGEAARLQTRVVEGRPADAIVSYAAENGMGLIVMGTHGRSGVNRWMLGSVAEHVVRASRVPVLTVGPGRRSLADPVAIRHILCPVNNSPAAREALAIAAELAACCGARVTALHVQGGAAQDSIPDLCAWIGERYRGQCEIQEAIRHGDAATQIVSAAAESDCDVAVMGAQHRAFFDSTVLGTTTVRVLRHARCPVLTVVSRDQRS